MRVIEVGLPQNNVDEPLTASNGTWRLARQGAPTLDSIRILRFGNPFMKASAKSRVISVIREW
jgi:hypothetical protein